MTRFLVTTVVVMLSITSGAQQNPRSLEFTWETDTSIRKVDHDEFIQLMQPDGIPPIDEPIFWNKAPAMEAYFKHEPVIAIEFDGEARAYPLSVLMHHEIVNDRIGDKIVTVTYCPLCNAAIVFDRLHVTRDGDSILFDFGVSGMLRNSDMVMYDRQTESWWQQFTGEAIVGTMTGEELKMLPSMIISLEQFYETYPDGTTLSTQNEHDFDYTVNPYENYDDTEADPRIFTGMFGKTPDKRLPPMERVITITTPTVAMAYPMSEITKERVINDQVGEEYIVIFYSEGTVSVLSEKIIREARDIGSATVFSPVVDGDKLTFEINDAGGFKDNVTGSVWDITGKCIKGKLKGKELKLLPHGNHFAFAWFEFEPESMVYEAQ